MLSSISLSRPTPEASPTPPPSTSASSPSLSASPSSSACSSASRPCFTSCVPTSLNRSVNPRVPRPKARSASASSPSAYRSLLACCSSEAQASSSEPSTISAVSPSASTSPVWPPSASIPPALATAKTTPSRSSPTRSTPSVASPASPLPLRQPIPSSPATPTTMATPLKATNLPKTKTPISNRPGSRPVTSQHSASRCLPDVSSPSPTQRPTPKSPSLTLPSRNASLAHLRTPLAATSPNTPTPTPNSTRQSLAS